MCLWLCGKIWTNELYSPAAAKLELANPSIIFQDQQQANGSTISKIIFLLPYKYQKHLGLYQNSDITGSPELYKKASKA